MDEEKAGTPTDPKTQEEAVPAAPAEVYNPGAKAPLTKKSFWRVLISLEMSMFAIALDFYSVPGAVPWISLGDLGYANSAWLGAPFLMSFALGLLIWPRLCAGFSYKLAFIVAIETFNYGSTWAATSHTAGRRIAYRIVAGAGAGGVSGLFDMILRDIVPPEEFERYMSATRAIWAVTAAASPVMAGALIEYVFGEWHFNLDYLPGQIGYMMALFFLNLPEPSWSQTVLRLRQFDYLGSLCLTAGTVCTLLVTASGDTFLPWIADHVVGLSISGLACLTAFFCIEPLVPDPLLPPSLFHNHALFTTVVAAFFYGANLVGTMYYVPHFFKVAFQDNAMKAGVSTQPFMMGLGVGIALSLFITSRYQNTSVKTARIGAAFLALASGLMVRWAADTSREETNFVLIILGVSQGAVMISLLRTAQVSVKRVALGPTTRLFMFVQALGYAFGVACFAALSMHDLCPSVAASVLGKNETLPATESTDKVYGVLRRLVLDEMLARMQNGWWLMFACALVVLVLSFLVDQSQSQQEVDTPLAKVDDEEEGLLDEKGV